MRPLAVLRAGALGSVLSLAPDVSSAQDTPLAVILPELLGNTITLRPSNLPDQPLHVAHFRPGAAQLRVPEQVNQALTLLISTYPIGTPAGRRLHVSLRSRTGHIESKQR
jgi:hypothetical protein